MITTSRPSFLMTRALYLAAGLLIAGQGHAATLAEGFVHPPADARPMIRWWWFGPAVTDTEIVREIKTMRAGGFGGFEIQPVYPLSLDDPANGIRNLPYLSDDFLHAVHLANETGRAEGMRVDITLGSGWPYGGPHIGVEEASNQIKLVKISVPVRAEAVDLPSLSAGQHRVAAFLTEGDDPKTAAAVTMADRITVAPADHDRTLMLIMQTPTGQQVKRPGVGGEGYVLDHMSADAVQHHLHAVADRLMTAFGDHPPYSVFSDSLEVYGADWTDDLLAEFHKRRGYDLTPHLLDLFYDTPQSADIRHDWALTLSELTEDRYLTPINDWAKAHGTKFRSQTYGFPPVTLSSNRLVTLPEGEQPNWRAFTATRWASSANHIYGNPVTSAESWTWLHGGAFRATPLDIKAEADTLLLEGVNQFIAHGWPYSPPSVPEPGWSFYAAAVFNDHNPWWGVMPDVTAYLQRMSYLLRQGENVADVAILLPEDDALASIKPGQATVNGQMNRFVTAGLTAQILDNGYSFDYTDAAAIRAKGVGHKVLILPHVARLDAPTRQAIADFQKAGGIVIEVTDEAALGQALKARLAPDLTDHPAQVGFVHRKLKDGDLYFVANTGNTPVTAALHFRAETARGQWWEPRTGAARGFAPGTPVTLAPYESRVFVFGAAAKAAPIDAPPVRPLKSDLSAGWTISFGQKPQPLTAFASWADDPKTRNFSGTAIYRRTLTLTRAQIAAGQVVLNFGEGTPLPIQGPRQMGTSARLDAPVRDSAEVYVNGQRAGSVWAAPFTLSLKGLVHAGANALEIRVSNTAINELAGRPPTDYSALTAKFGERFSAQGMKDLKPLPSGLLHPLTLETPQ